MLPLTLLRAAQGSGMLVELKNGDTYNGRLVNCDSWMNINLQDVVCTSRDGERFTKLSECYIRGNSIKYLRIPEEVIDQVPEEEVKPKQQYQGRGGRGHGGRLATKGRGGKGGRGGGKGAHGSKGGKGGKGGGKTSGKGKGGS